MADQPPEAVFEAAFQCCSVSQSVSDVSPLPGWSHRVRARAPGPANRVDRPPVRMHDAAKQVEFSPFHPRRLAVATAQYFGIIGNGR